MFNIYFALFLEDIPSEVYRMTMPNEAEMIKIKTNFTNSLKCPETKYHWTSWNSYTNLSETDSDGNDYETLDLHRSKFEKFVML